MITIGDCLHVMRTLPDNSVDSIVTDPPYGLTQNKKGGTGVASVNLDNPYGRARIGTGNGAGGFMGMKWDHDVPSVEIWAEALRVLKPGGYLLAFAGTRTQHRMACRIEDAGFEIRDMLAWVYGSGFPKSLDVSKALDKAAGAAREQIPATGGLHKNRNLNDDGWSKIGDSSAMMGSNTPATDAARQWEGWGTALKPALEPITLARKPLIGTVAANVTAHGTGGLNIDGCRVETTENLNGGAYAQDGGRTESQSLRSGGGMNQPGKTVGREFEQPVGRWPANLIHDGSEEVVALFPQTTSGQLSPHHKRGEQVNAYGASNGAAPSRDFGGDSGSAARFFYCAKASGQDRDDGADNSHPTVKPTDLMRWLCRLVTPPGGLVLDPFTGSGSTGRGAILEGFAFMGIELSPDYAAIAQSRIAAAVEQRRIDTAQLDLFAVPA